MAFADMDFDSFNMLRQAFFSPGAPIDTIEHLKGREKQLGQINRCLTSIGRQLFIYGERGVGKTSLARTAAFQAPGYNFEPVYIGCDRQGTFYQLAAALIDELAGRMDQTQQRTTSSKTTLLIKVLGYERGESSLRIYPKFESLSQFVQALKALCEMAPKPPIVVIDELERLEGAHDRSLLADFIRRVSDDKINVSLIVCGIAKSLTELIGDHPSSERSFSPIELKALRHDNLWEIVSSAAEAFKVDVPDGLVQRIGVISDGFPYYAHLLVSNFFGLCTRKGRLYITALQVISNPLSIVQ